MNANNTFILNAVGAQRRKEVLFPLIKDSIDKEESFLVTSSGGSLIDYLSRDLTSHQYRIIYLDLSDVDAYWSWNPLQYAFNLYNQGEYDYSIEQVRLLASSIMDKSSNSYRQDPFWANAASGLFEAIVLSLFKNADSRVINLTSVLNMVIEGISKKGSGTSTVLNEYFNLEQCKEFANTASAFLSAPSETRASICSVFNQALSDIIGNQQFSRHMHKDEIHLQKTVHTKTAIIINFSESSQCTTLIGLMITQLCYILMRETAHENNEFSFTFYFDRFLNIGRIAQIEQHLSFGMDANIHFVLMVDNIAMLESVYGVDTGKVLREYCDRWVIYPTRNQKMVEELKVLIDFYGKNEDTIKDIKETLINDKPIIISEGQGVDYLVLKSEELFSYKAFKRPKCHSALPSPSLFSISDYVSEQQKREKFAELDRGRISYSDRNALSHLSSEELLRRIDEKIAEIEAERKKPRSDNN